MAHSAQRQSIHISLAYWVFLELYRQWMSWRLLLTQCKDHKNAWGCHFLYAGRNCFTSVILLPISLGKLLFLGCLLLWAVALFACPGLLCLRHESLEEEEAKVQKHHLESTDDLTKERRKPCLVSNEYLNYLIISFLRKKHFWVKLCAQTAWLWIPQ